MGDALVGRDDTVATVRALLDGAAAGAGGALVLHGPAGIGKTAILDWAAQAGDFQVLRGSAAQEEYVLSYGLIAQLLRPVLVLEGAEEPFTVGRDALELVTTMAEQRPVLIIADDLHWADTASASVLAFLGRRLGADRVALLCAYRDDESADGAGAGLPELALGPLGDEAADLVVRRHAPALPLAARRRVLAEAEGNPLALAEFAVAARSPEALARGSLALTERLEKTFADRAAGLPESTRIALTVAALGEGGLDEVVAATGLVVGDARFASDDLEPAVEGRMIDRPALLGAVRFRHPLMRSAMRHGVPEAVRRACHRALAEVNRDDPGRRAWHRAAAADRADEPIAAELETAGNQLSAGANPAAAYRMYLRAAELTPGHDARQRRLAAALFTAFDMGDHREVVRLCGIVDPRPLDLPSRLAIALQQEALVDRRWSGSLLLNRFADEAGLLPPGSEVEQVVRALRVLVIRLYWGVGEGDPVRTAMLGVLDRLPGGPSSTGRIISECMLAPVDRAASVLRQVRETHVSPALRPSELWELGLAAQVCGDMALAGRLLTRAVSGMRQGSSIVEFVNALSSLCLQSILEGDVRQASVLADEITALVPEAGLPLYDPTARAMGAAAAGLRGDADTAERLASQAEQVLVPFGAIPVLALVRMCRGLTALGQNRPGEAYEELVTVFTPTASGYHHAFRLLLTQPLAEAAILAGRRDELAEQIAVLEPIAERTGSPILRIGLNYARAVLADDDELFRHAMSDPDLTVLDRAHLELAFGRSMRLRRRAVESRSFLRSAQHTYEALGMAPWAESARAQLRAAGERVETPTSEAADLLTPQELHIAALAAQGLTNREIAQRLYVSHRTIGAHLYHIYPKLGVTSRNELAAALGPLSGELAA
ncbi:AAA family ATPase [Paractinoplanes atraurantiacus]|uniref:Regulatory protein, luxR family n=1 Tax=Paractinoplanes atraurantiacus TaxID=1036182 RepID=A0A285J862_9ACTN|nr:LuxR family transcriptional regulator [Actinoplanes atraurantiacus]SNY56402.1 regulatory protein, luxR family [Actinoplanes atraurantiacus]